MAMTRVLVVDDDEMIRVTLCKVLESHGFEVTCADVVPEALKSIHFQQYDGLLIDWVPSCQDQSTSQASTP